MKKRLMKSSFTPTVLQHKSFFGAVEAAFSSPRVQRKLTVGATGDRYEQQADAMADQVVRRLAGDLPQVQTKCEACKAEEESLQRQTLDEEEGAVQAKADHAPAAAADGSTTVAPQVEQRLRQSLGGGDTLPAQALQRMNGAFGVDFSTVRLHTSPEAVQLSRELGARAFTYGRDVFLGQAGYDPESPADNHLLAHELTHVVQQGGVPAGTVQNKGLADTILRQCNTPDLQLMRVDYPSQAGGRVQHSSQINSNGYIDGPAWVEDDVLLFEFTYNGSDSASVTISLFDDQKNGYIGGGVLRWESGGPVTQYIEFTEFPPSASGGARNVVIARAELVNESRKNSGISAYERIFRGR